MQYLSHRMLAVCLTVVALAGCSGSQPGTWSQDGAALATASMLRNGDSLASLHLGKAINHLLHLGLNAPEATPPLAATPLPSHEPIPRVRLGLCERQSDPTLISACCAGQETGADGDRDGMADACEDLLAERFAPIIYHSTDESNYPTNVDKFLASSRLTFHDDACTPDLREVITEAPEQHELIGHQYTGGCGSTDVVRSDGTVSSDKHRGFVLEDVPDAERIGSLDSRDWTTYVHAYPSAGGAVTIQYWQFFSYNDAVNNHGGDWEGVQLVLDSSLRAISVRLPGHWGNLGDWHPRKFRFEGTHVRVFSEGGGHAMRESGEGIVARGCGTHELCTIQLGNRATFVRQETWTGGEVSWNDGRRTENGPLVNVGSKTAPLNGQVFIQYSGLWGSPGLFYWNSGYWGPAFNEGRLGQDGYRAAWCLGMQGPSVAQECYARSTSR